MKSLTDLQWYDKDGKLVESYPAPPDTAGTYVLKCVVTVSGDTITKTYQWVQEE